MPKKGTKAYKDETVMTFYGINPRTLEVEHVHQTRGGMLSKWGKNSSLHTHLILSGRQARDEVVIVYGLEDILEVPPGLQRADHPEIKKLEEKAAKMRAERDAKKAENKDGD